MYGKDAVLFGLPVSMRGLQPAESRLFFLAGLSVLAILCLFRRCKIFEDMVLSGFEPTEPAMTCRRGKSLALQPLIPLV